MAKAVGIAPDLDIHLIADNYATHKHPNVEAWLARHPRFHMHFTPTSASWLNLVERFFAKITRKRIRRGVFRSVVFGRQHLVMSPNSTALLCRCSCLGVLCCRVGTDRPHTPTPSSSGVRARFVG